MHAAVGAMKSQSKSILTFATGYSYFYSHDARRFEDLGAISRELLQEDGEKMLVVARALAVGACGFVKVFV